MQISIPSLFLGIGSANDGFHSEQALMRYLGYQRPLVVTGFILPMFGSAFIASGCVVRTQDFHCTLQSDPNQNLELRMTPTSLDLDSTLFSFVEEQGAKRIYQNKELQRQVTFDLASSALEQSQAPDKRWTCKRYEPY
jgi:hypothetical protein